MSQFLPRNYALNKHDKELAEKYDYRLTYGDGRKTPLWYSLYTEAGRDGYWKSKVTK